MLPVSKKIMEVFKLYKIGRKEALSWPSFESKTKRWERDFQDQLNEGFDELIKMQYIRIPEDKFSIFLLDAGYNYLYPPRTR